MMRRDTRDTITPIENGTFESGEDIRTLVRYLELLDDVSIGVWKNGRLSETIYRDGAFADAWTDSAFLPNTAEGYTSEKPGSLFQMVLKRADGSQIDAGTEFRISYKMKLNTDQPWMGRRPRSARAGTIWARECRSSTTPRPPGPTPR